MSPVNKECLGDYKNLTPNNELLDRVIVLMSKQTGGVVSVDEIKQRLQENGFNGLYIVDDKTYEKLYNQNDPYIGKGENSLGCYIGNTKTIIIRKKHLSNRTVKHELFHALLDDRLNRTIKVDSESVCYGVGFEEGLASLAETMNEKEGIDSRGVSFHNSTYFENARIVILLDYLYKLDKNKKYPNLFILAIKEPDKFLSTLYDVIYDIVQKSYSFGRVIRDENALTKEEEAIESYKIAFQILTYCDYLIKKTKNEDYEVTQEQKELRDRLYTILIWLLNIKDKRIRKGTYPKKYTKWISQATLDSAKLDSSYMNTAEKRLIYMIYGNPSYDYELIKKIEKLVAENYNYLDDLDTKKEFHL